jgi:serine/threonine protein kinase
MTDAPPRISGYTIRQPLGGGVFLAHDDARGRSVAIQLLPSPPGEHFLRDARAVAAIEHPNAVRVLAYGIAERRPYLVTELVDGESLAGKRMRVGDAMRLMRPVVAALAASPAHGAVQPSNVLIDRNGVAHLTGFLPGARDAAKDIRDLLAMLSELTGGSMLAKEYASYDALLRDIDRLIAETAPTARETRVPELPPVRRARWPVWVGLAIVIVIGIVALVRRKPAPAPPAVRPTTTTVTVTATR